MMGKLQAGLLASMMAFSGTVTAQSNWSYSGSNGPANWHSLSPANAICRTGRQQSPINIEGTEPVIMHRLITNYTVAPVNLRNDRLAINMPYTDGSFLNIGAKAFQLRGFTFRVPAEHAVSGTRHPMSIQFFHEDLNGQKAIVEVLVKEGKAHLAAQELWELMPLEADQVMKHPKTLVNARDLMPTDKSYYRYMGSLTTPPCSEGVHWYVLKNPIELSKDQIALVNGILGGQAARPLQNRNNRIILDARPQQ